MKRLAVVLLLLTLLVTSSAQADWRWTPPKFSPHKVTYSCDNLDCVRKAYQKEKTRYERKIERYDAERLAEWEHWTHLYIPMCTWYGESGFGPEYARYRYSMPNNQGSGAWGKYQLMPLTYFDNDKYGDWSPLDQEIASRREFWRHGTGPWQNC
jgi:hypothetical protein